MVDATPALVGRARELAEIEGALDRLAGGEPWFVQIVGEPGIGKSRLLAELCRRGEDRGYLVLDGRAAEFERDIPFGLIVDALNDYLGSLDPALLRALDEDLLAELASIFPSLPRTSGSPAPPGRRRRALPAALRDQKRARAADHAPADAARARRRPLGRRRVGRGADAPAAPVPRAAADRGRLPPAAPAARSAPSRRRRAPASGPGWSSRRSAPRRRRRLIGDDVDEATRARSVSRERRQPVLHRAAGAGEPRPIRSSAPAPEPLRGAVPRAVIAAIQRGAERRLGRVARDARGRRGRRRVVRTRAGRRDRRADRDRRARGAWTSCSSSTSSARPTRRGAFASGTRSCAAPCTTRCRDGWRIGAHARAAAALAAAHAPASRARAPRRELGDGRATSRRSRCSCRPAATPPPARRRPPGAGCSRRPGCCPRHRGRRAAPVAAQRGGERADLRRRLRRGAGRAGRGERRLAARERPRSAPGWWRGSRSPSG